MDMPDSLSRKWTNLVLGALLSLVLLSFFLAWNRIIQVDEAQNVMMARIIAFGRTSDFMASAPLMLLGPLVWMARGADSSADLFHHIRLLFACLMWLNLALMVKATGTRLRSREGLVLLLIGATIEPLWDYGFEIRHDNLLLTGVLGLWLILRPLSRRLPWANLFAGIVAALMQFVAFKAFLFYIPIIAYTLALSSSLGQPKSRARRLAELLAGLILGLTLGWLAHFLSGTWPLFIKGFIEGARYSASGVERFAPWDTLHRLLVQVPLLVGGVIAVLVTPLISNWNRGWEGRWQLFQSEHAPEWGFAVISIVAFLANPTPFPYNLILMVPVLFILLVRHRHPVVKVIRDSTQGWLLWPLLCSAHLLPWLTSTPRHLDFSNLRQLQVATLAENLTDPNRHRIFDGSGLVPTRDPIGYRWLVHTFTIGSLSDGTWPSIRSELAKHEVPVILPNYRISWLPKEDQHFISSHYIALAQDFMVLGASMEKGGGSWTALAPGNYFLIAEGQGDPLIRIDGQPAQPGPLRIERGNHHFQFSNQHRITFVWSGPRGERPPTLGYTRQPLFVNWY